MNAFDTFKAQLEEFATNNVTALEGHIQVTFAERENLRLMWAKLDKAEQPKAKDLAKARGVDVANWV